MSFLKLGKKGTSLKFRVFLLKRLIFLIPVFFGVSFFSWLLSDISGDPITAYIGNPMMMTEEEIQALERSLGFDRPWPERYIAHFLRFISGDWGTTGRFFGEQPVLSLIQRHFPASIELAIFSMAIAVSIGIPLGIFSAVNKNKSVDTLVRSVYLSGYSIPLFLMAMIVSYLIFQFTFELGLFLNDRTLIASLPYRSRYNTDIFHYPNRIVFDLLPSTGILLLDSLLSFNFILFLDSLFHIISPAFVVATPQIALISRMTRMAMMSTLKSDYILLARAKGLKERTILYKHALRNAILPTLTVGSIVLANLMTGIIFVEMVFAWPGLGTFLYTAIYRVDLPAITGFVMITTLVYLTTNFLVDLAYSLIDPRMRDTIS